jgi:D-lyxose isomerase
MTNTPFTRSLINRSIGEAMETFARFGLALPPWAFWSPAEWAEKGPECDEIRDCMLGWDVTDFGSGDFPNIGRTLFTEDLCTEVPLRPRAPTRPGAFPPIQTRGHLLPGRRQHPRAVARRGGRRPAERGTAHRQGGRHCAPHCRRRDHPASARAERLHPAAYRSPVLGRGRDRSDHQQRGLQCL